MNFKINFLLFIFISFLSMPTVVVLIENNVDVSYFYSNAEEEEIQKETKCFNFMYCTNLISTLFLKNPFLNKTIINDNNFSFNLISRDIVIPPPKFII